MSKLLSEYIRLALSEAGLARVPQQLLSPDTVKDAEDGEEEPKDMLRDEGSVNEFSGVGAIAGYTAPLGMSPDRLGRKKNKA